MAIHFVGFRDDRIWAARKVFGMEDFSHVHWDLGAIQEVVEGDVVVFAGIVRFVPWSYDDSNQPDDPAAAERKSENRSKVV
jgi:hypothetical protein